MTDRRIEAIQPLTPMQEGMLFHTLLDRDAYLQQLRCRLEGPIDVPALERAWQSVVDRHAALRSVFVWEGINRPVQVVMAECSIAIECIDTDDPDAWIAADRARGIALDKAPLMRFALLRLGHDVHELVWTHSHLLLDGWSTSIVFAELCEALATGTAPNRPAPRYGDYVAWLQRQDSATAERFWRRELAGFTAATPLVLERKCDAAADWRELRVRVDAPPLAERARRERVTLNSVLAAAWALLLARTAEESDVVIGVTVAGRPAELPDIESAVGLFINTIPLRLQVPMEASTGEWLRGVQERLAQVRELEFASLPRIRQWSDVAPGTPLFESLFVYENYPLAADPRAEFGGLRITDIVLPERTNYPLTVIAEPASDSIDIRLVYDLRRFDDAAAARYASMYRVLLDAFASSSDAPLDSLPLMSDAERHRLVHEWNATDAPWERDACIHELFERQASRTPDALAVTDGRSSLSYAELRQQSAAIARHLAESGVRRGSFVGICMARGNEMVPALLAVLRLGAAYVPVEPSWPDARIEVIFSSLGVRHVLTQSCLAARFAGCTALAVDALDLGGDPMPPAGTSADDIAYVIFTSGSTGSPKGVVVRHRPVINLIGWVNETFGMSARDRVLFITSLSFDLSVYDVFGLLACGGSIRVASEADVSDPEALVSILRDEPITYWDSAPAALLQCVPFFPPPAERTLRLVFLSGDWVPLTLRDDVVASFPGADVIALGGATEATVWSNWFRIGARERRWVSIPYGKPIHNARYYVLDGRGEPVPPGIPGDLFIGGEVLADGYAGNPQLTAEKFVADPFTAGRMYRTGDRARFFEDGNLEFLGRLDQQVKIRGFRIELGEIEAILRTHPAVREPLVVVRDEGGDRRLVAYILGDTSDPAMLRAHLAQRLPSYMIPSAFVFPEAFPVTANGKLDRKALPPPEMAARTPPPSDPVAALVSQIWCEVLGVDSIEIDRDFFDAGGHSLLAVRVVSKLREAFGIDVPLRIIFDEPTIERQASAMRSGWGGRASAPIARVHRGESVTPSFAQTRLWFLQQLDPASPFYNVPLAAEVDGALDIEAFRRAVEEIARRHEVLRGRFLPGDGEPLHVLDDRASVPLEEIDARGGDAEAILTAFARRPFDLAADRLIRAAVVRTGSEDYRILIVIHHIACDGWSMAVLVREIEALYRAFASGAASPLRALPIQYADYAAWQREALSPERLAMLLDWWRRRLAGAVPSEIASDRPRPGVQSFRGSRHAFAFTPELSSALRALARREGTTLFMTLTAAFNLLLAWETGNDDVVIGTDVANRNNSDTQDLIGFFVNQLVLRTSIAGVSSFSDLLRRVRATCVDAYAHQEVPFERIVQTLNPQRDASRMPLFQIKLVLQDVPERPFDLPDLRVTPLSVETRTAKYDILLTVEDTPALQGTIDYASDLYDGATIARLADRWLELLRLCALAPDWTPAELRRSVDAASSPLTCERERLRREEGLRKLRAVRRAMVTRSEPS